MSQTTPTLVVHGTADERVPPRAALDTFACAAAPKRLLLIHDGDHCFRAIASIREALVV